MRVAILSAILLSGCVLAPKGMHQEQTRANKAGAAFEPAVEKRDLPELSDTPSWRAILNRAFLSNGELEAAYFEWQAAMQRINMAASWPNSNLQLGFEYMFSSENLKSWDRTTISAGFDPANSLSLPNKVAKAGEIAFADARAKGLLFEQMKFDIQRNVLTLWLDYVRMAEMTRIEQDNVALLRLLSETASARVQAGAAQQDLLKAQTQQYLAENELASMRAQLVTMRAMLNAMVARDPEATLNAPDELPGPRAMPPEDAKLIAVAVDKNKELAGFAQQVQGRRDALELAKLQWLPDINPAAGFTGSIEQFLGAMVMLPTNAPMISARINESRAMLRAQEAMLRQKQRDRGAEVVAALVTARNAQRQTELFEQTILPRARQALDSARQGYTAGRLAFIELIDAQRTLLDVRRMIADARTTREKALAELERLICADVETLLVPAATQSVGGI